MQHVPVMACATPLNPNQAARCSIFIAGTGSSASIWGALSGRIIIQLYLSIGFLPMPRRSLHRSTELPRHQALRMLQHNLLRVRHLASTLSRSSSGTPVPMQCVIAENKKCAVVTPRGSL